MDKFVIRHHGDRSECPICHGLLKPKKSLSWVCSDCGSFFFPVDDGKTERELTYEAIKGRVYETTICAG